MAHWFLSTRAHSVGGPVGPVKVIDTDQPGSTSDLTQELIDDVAGKEVFFGTHGFNVNEQHGTKHLGYWFDALQIGSAVPIGILWPGDCILPIFVDYVVEGHEAIKSGELLSAFINKNLKGVATLSFASHSLGARLVLQLISGLNEAFNIRRAILMAGAIDDNCLTAEYSKPANRIGEISILASRCDLVLAAAYPLGNPIQGIIDQGHPYHQAALGRTGPAPIPVGAPRIRPPWQIPENLDYGHLNYLPGVKIIQPYPQPVTMPPEKGPVPPAGTPLAFGASDAWKPAWSAGFATARFQ